MEITRADGQTVRLRQDVAAEHRITAGDPLDDAALARAEAESQRREAWRIATGYLAPRARSKRELRTRLRRAAFDDAVVQATIERLRSLHYLDDEAFAVEWVASRTGRRARGRALVQSELRRKGVADEIIAAALDTGYGDETEVARPLAERRARQLRGAGYPTFRQRLGAYLSQRGFNYDAADTLVRELWETYGSSEPDDAA